MALVDHDEVDEILAGHYRILRENEIDIWLKLTRQSYDTTTVRSARRGD